MNINRLTTVIVSVILITFALFLSTIKNVEASEIVWSQNSTTDCSYQGGTNGRFDNICFNTLGTNSTTVWNNNIVPSINIPVIIGHRYILNYTTPFSYSSTNGNFDIIINYLTDGYNLYRSGYNRSDWLYAGDGYRDGTFNFSFTAWSDTLVFVWGAGCDSSTGCYANNITLTDLDNELGTPTPKPSPQPVPEELILFSDDFEGENTGMWNIISGSWIKQYIKGSYRFGLNLNTPSTGVEAQAGDFVWNDYDFSLDILPLYGTSRNIFFRSNADRTNIVPNLNLPVGYGILLNQENIILQKFTLEYATELMVKDNLLPDNEITHIKIRLQGNNIKIFINYEDNPVIEYTDYDNPITTGRIALSETTGGNYPTEVWFDNILVTKIPKNDVVTKTIFTPGIMGSWNADAILNCQIDTNAEWILAPYAEDIYQPIIDAIGENGWTTLPFYYDWRKNISQNSDKLANFINENTSSNEKVNLVGHSMGGLVGRNYLQASEGGKLASLLTVGAPNRGSVYAYPPWEGGDVWSNSFIEKIALTLYLKHCGKILPNDKETIQNNVPSIKDLLPIDPYLQNNKTQEIYSPQNPNNQNTWLSNLSNNTNPWSVKLGYIAGTGVNTLKTIQTKDPNKKDTKTNIWEDGKPVGKITTTEGDGTVLLNSAILPNTPEEYKYVINQNHRGLVSSVDGMSKILEFLGQPENGPTTSSLTNNYVDSDSALIIIGYPANFIVTDKNGQIKRAKDGMVAFMNPINGSYKIELLPKSNNTLFIVAQFLPNGEVKYKEYNFKGTGPKFKNLKFSLENPQEDILTN